MAETSDQNLDLESASARRRNSNVMTFNCTVVYMSQCLSWNKCRTNCQSMGSTSYRWFHDGCCECIGSMCLNYGINESRCDSCPDNGDDNDEEDQLDYGDGPIDEY